MGSDALKAEAGKNKEETQTIIDKRIWEVKQEMFKGWKGFIDTANHRIVTGKQIGRAHV